MQSRGQAEAAVLRLARDVAFRSQASSSPWTNAHLGVHTTPSGQLCVGGQDGLPNGPASYDEFRPASTHTATGTGLQHPAW